ncbi:hypothetical protein [Delftia lacustris]|uniref:hypothetical protein n=1 Tax=Delftia lacustris TaxID=558537 RepID=UPI000A4096BE|nr:hypothetical protein [Delftia lacustris]
MDANEIYNGIAKAVEAAQPAQEYCLKYFDQTWRTCMTKAEWSGWAQAVFSVFAIFIAAIVPYVENLISRSNKEKEAIVDAQECYRLYRDHFGALDFSLHMAIGAVEMCSDYLHLKLSLDGFREYISKSEGPSKMELLKLERLGDVVEDGGTVGSDFSSNYKKVMNAINSLFSYMDKVEGGIFGHDDSGIQAFKLLNDLFENNVRPHYSCYAISYAAMEKSVKISRPM